MYTYQRQLKDGTVKEFVFEHIQKTDRKLNLFYDTDDADEIFKTKYYSYEKYISSDISDGYIIYPLDT